MHPRHRVSRGRRRSGAVPSARTYAACGVHVYRSICGFGMTVCMHVCACIYMCVRACVRVVFRGSLVS